jgi:hypothetical protein
MSEWRSCRDRRLLLGVAAAALCLLARTPPATAAKHPAGKQARERSQEREARKACLNGDYNKGAAILSELFVATEDPTFIFNQGRCFEQNQRYDDAIARFREYLRAGGDKLDPQDEDAAERHIADCRELLAQERGNSPSSTPSQVIGIPPSSVAETPRLATTPESPASVVSQPAPARVPTSDGSRLRISGAILAAFGVVALGGAIALNLKANSTVDEIRKIDGYTKEAERQRYETLSWIGYGVGAASLVTGAILYGFGLRAKHRASTSVALLPALGIGQAGVIVGGAF